MVTRGVGADVGPSSLLAGTRVLEVADLAGALAGRLLADLGAEVVRVDPRGDTADLESAAATFRHANKTIAPIDPTGGSGRERFGELIAGSDILITYVGEAVRTSLGLDPRALAARHPALVHIAIADFGLDGPRAGWRLTPLTALAASGAQFASGFPDLPPCAMPGFLAFDCAAVFALLGSVAGLTQRRRTGTGCCVEISVQEAALNGLVPWSIPVADYADVLSDDLPVDGRRNAEGSHSVLPVADGFVRVMTSSTAHWQAFLKLCGGLPAFEGEPWSDPLFRRDHADVIKEAVGGSLADRTRADLTRNAHALGATLAPVLRPLEFVAHEQTLARGVFADVNGDPVARSPFTCDGERPEVTAARIAHVGWGRPPTPERDIGTPTGDQGPLEGVRVVEFGVAAVGPECSLMLSELGADVIKVESRVRPDVLRRRGGSNPNASYTYNTECRGRRNVALDLTTEEGVRLARELCRRADVVVENMRGGTMDRLGLGPAAIRELNPRVVYASSQGFGRGGPLGMAPAWGQLNSCFTGAHHSWNLPDAPYPCGTSLNHPDHIAGKWLAALVVAALDRRTRSGVGADIELAQTEAAAFLMGDLYVAARRAGRDLPVDGNGSDEACPHSVFPACGADRWVAVVCPDTTAFERLAALIGLDVKPEWSDLSGRLADRREIEETIAAWTSGQASEAVAAALQRVGVSAVPVMGPLDHRADPHLLGRGAIVAVENPNVGVEHHIGNPLRSAELGLRVATHAPAIGEHTAEVLGDVLGLPAEEIARLIDSRVCW